jgi:hypothetical protein
MNQLGFADCQMETFLDKLSSIVDAKNREEVDRIRRRGMNLVGHRAAQIYDLVNNEVGNERLPAWT